MAESFLERMRRSSHLAGSNVAYIEDLYESFLDDPNSVSVEWRDYFDKLPRVGSGSGGRLSSPWTQKGIH
jgi:2-oxoglutarate dehydrogenase E1 component